MSKEHHDEDVVKKLKRVYRETVGYAIENHIGGQELEEVQFSDIGLDDSEVEEFLAAVNEEFSIDVEAGTGTFGEFITMVEFQANLV